MNTRTAALASLVVAAGIAGGAATAQAHPGHTYAHPTSTVALTRLQTLLQTSAPVNARAIRPNDNGTPSH